MTTDDCPNTPTGKHLLAGNYANVQRVTDFEPVSYGESRADTLYRRVEYTIASCQCGYSQKRRVVQREADA